MVNAASETKYIALFLALVVLVQFGYPITHRGQLWLGVYQLLYTLMFLSGVLVAREKPWQLKINLASAVVFLTASIWYLLEPSNDWANLATFAALLPFQFIVIYSLVRFIRFQDRVRVGTLLAAVSIYLLIGAMFVPLYGVIETVQPGSFVDDLAPEEAVSWQQFIYYSYVTLNTVGYGDIRPINSWARSLSTLEAVVGILYIALAIARLVSLYNLEERRDA